METREYKCPNCSAGLVFDSKKQKMVCEFCDSSYTVEELKQMYPETEKEESWEGFQPEEWTDGESRGIGLWQCSSCGGEIIADEVTGAAVCPYCGNPTIQPIKFEGLYKPDYVIPFQYDKKQALAELKKMYKKHGFLPSVFTDENHLEEIKGMYVPFWLFNANVFGDFVFDGRQIHHSVEGDYDVTRTSYYKVRRAGHVHFTRIPVDGNENVDDTMMESIEPFDYKGLKPFDYSYLSGYFANRYDQEPDTLTNRVYDRVRQSTEQEIKKTAIGYTELFTLAQRMEVKKDEKVSYALLPVWFLNTRWNDKKYTFVMNGQTGKMCGDLPADKGKAWLYFGKMTGILTAIFTVVLTLLGIGGVI